MFFICGWLQLPTEFLPFVEEVWGPNFGEISFLIFYTSNLNWQKEILLGYMEYYDELVEQNGGIFNNMGF